MVKANLAELALVAVVALAAAVADRVAVVVAKASPKSDTCI